MAGPTRRDGRPALVVYRVEACARAAVGGTACPDHGDRGCPIEGEEPRPGGARASAALSLPILKSESVPDGPGREATVFQVASLVSDRAPIVAPAEPPPDL